jgi:hypothetical protein
LEQPLRTLKGKKIMYKTSVYPNLSPALLGQLMALKYLRAQNRGRFYAPAIRSA